MVTTERPSSMYDGDEAPEARRSGLRVAALVGGAGVLLAATVVGLVVWNDGRSSGSGTSATVVDTTGAAEPGQEVENMVERTTDGGLVVRLLTTDDQGMFGGGEPPPGAPPWCFTVGGAAITLISPAAVGQSSMPITKQAHPDGAGVLITAGLFERAPMVGVMTQTPSDVTMVRLIAPGLGVDEMKPIDGIAAVAVELPPEAIEDNGFLGGIPPIALDNANATVELERAGGERESIDLSVFAAGLPVWNDQRCWNVGPAAPDPNVPPPKPPDLPAAGAQPDDPVAARSSVENALTTLFTAPMEEGREYFDYIDDASGLDINIGPRDQAKDMFVVLLEESEVTMTDLVFISPVEAFFYYDIENSIGGTYINRLGRARFVDGAWKITRGTFCQELATMGGYCGV